MPRKKTVPFEEPNTGMDTTGLPESETTEGMDGFPEMLPEPTGEELEIQPSDAPETLPENTGEEETPQVPEETPAVPPEDGEPLEVIVDVQPEEMLAPNADAPLNLPESPENISGNGSKENPLDTPPTTPSMEEVPAGESASTDDNPPGGSCSRACPGPAAQE